MMSPPGGSATAMLLAARIRPGARPLKRLFQAASLTIVNPGGFRAFSWVS